MNKISIQNFIGGFIAGCIGGAAAGFFCTDFSDALLSGGVWGGLVSLGWGKYFGESVMSIESFGVAGFFGGLASAVIYDGGYLAGFIGCGVGYALGLALPGFFLVLFDDE